MLKRLVLIAVLAAPLAAWAFFKPVRVLLPELAGVSCISESICIDDPSRSAQASALYQEALAFVGSTIGQIAHGPRVIFCATEACYRSFGFSLSSANTLGTAAIVIGPRAWKPYYVRHEMIHHLQRERLGNIKGWLITPEWFTEGMAYALSGDPRATLAQPWQQYRAQFEAWYRQIGKQRLWEEASAL